MLNFSPRNKIQTASELTCEQEKILQEQSLKAQEIKKEKIALVKSSFAKSSKREDENMNNHHTSPYEESICKDCQEDKNKNSLGNSITEAYEMPVIEALRKHFQEN